MSCRVSHCEKIVIDVRSLGRMSALCSLAYHLKNMAITSLYVNQDRLRLFGYRNTLRGDEGLKIARNRKNCQLLEITISGICSPNYALEKYYVMAKWPFFFLHAQKIKFRMFLHLETRFSQHCYFCEVNLPYGSFEEVSMNTFKQTWYHLFQQHLNYRLKLFFFSEHRCNCNYLISTS